MARDVTASGMQPVVDQMSELLGYPVRVTVMEPISHERQTRVAGVLAAVTAAGIVVESAGTMPLFPAEAPATVEVLHGGSLYWCHTKVQPGAAGQYRSMYLALPVEVQTTQRRRFPRVDLDMTVHVLVHDGPRVLEGAIRDISAGGAAVHLTDSLTEGQSVGLVFELGSGLYFQDLGSRVVRCTGTADGSYVVGLEFVCLAHQRAALAAWVNRQLEG